MPLRTEKYLAEQIFTIDALVPGDGALVGVPFEVYQTWHPSRVGGSLRATLREGATPRTTEVEVQWEFDALFQEECDFEGYNSWEMWENSSIILFPNARGEVLREEGMVLPEELFIAVKLFLAQLSVATRSPHFWSALRSSDLRDVRGTTSVTVAGRRIEMQPGAFHATLAVRSAEILREAAAAIARRPFPQYMGFLLTADGRLNDGDYRNAVVHLAQAMEVAAYAYARRIDAEFKKNFRVSLWFGVIGIRNGRHLTLSGDGRAFEQDTYEALCELFGTRHEWIHEGRSMVRLYDPVALDYGVARRELTYQDYYRFRSAVSKALEWMGELPIE